MNEKELFFKEFNDGLHRLGRLMLIAAVALLVAVPFVVGAVNGVAPDLGGFLSGFAKVGMTTVILGAVLNVILDPIFIFTLNLGVRGAAIATIVSRFVDGKDWLQKKLAEKIDQLMHEAIDSVEIIEVK